MLDDHAELRHLDQRRERNVVGGNILLDRSQFHLHCIVIVLEPFNPAQHFGKIERVDRDAAPLQQLFAIANRVEGGGARADCAYAKIGKTPHHAADGRKPRQVFAEPIRVRLHCVLRGKRIRNAVLHHVVAGRHLSAKAVAAVRDFHVRGPVGRGLHQHRDFQRREAQGIDNPALLPKIRKCNNHSIDFVAMLAEKITA